MLFCLFHPCSMVEHADLRMTRIPLNHGAGHMSALGFGTLIPDAAVTITATRDAPEAGFRHFDCAERYGNEREVGRALQAEIAGGENRLPGGAGFIAGSHRYSFCPAEGGFAAPGLFQPWKRDKSPAFHASRSPGVLRSQSGRISLVTARRSCQRSATDGRPQNQ
jgi:hypothetical protein